MSLNQSKTRPANSEKNVDFDLSKSSEFAATDTLTSDESAIESEKILLQCCDEIRTATTFAIFFSRRPIGHMHIYVLYIVRR